MRSPRCLLAACLVAASGALLAGERYNEPPLHYSRRTPNDLVSSWMATLPEGRPAFDRSSVKAYLASVLRELEVPAASQILVFSHTSLQNSKISPQAPRALYFSEDRYVGWVQGGDVELIDFDVRMGATFYRLSVPDLATKAAPEVRPAQNCLSCHAGNPENAFPGLLAFSVGATETGSQYLGADSFEIDHRSPLENRWGGWYVTGSMEGPAHRGNAYFSARPRTAGRKEPPVNDPKTADVQFGPRETLEGVVDMAPYLEAGSDIVALLVFEHQILAYNRLLSAYGNARIALYRDDEFMVGNPMGPGTRAVLETEAGRLLDAFLFKDEASLAGRRIRGGKAFPAAFSGNARRDSAGRSLKDFDLETRLFRYRCSYMIYSRAFAALPETLREVFWQKLDGVLNEPAGTGSQPQLTDGERAAIREILAATMPGVPAHWRHRTAER